MTQPGLVGSGLSDSRDTGRIGRVAEALEYGIVGINEGIISTEIRIEEYLEAKYLCMGGIDR